MAIKDGTYTGVDVGISAIGNLQSISITISNGIAAIRFSRAELVKLGVPKKAGASKSLNGKSIDANLPDGTVMFGVVNPTGTPPASFVLDAAGNGVLSLSVDVKGKASKLPKKWKSNNITFGRSTYLPGGKNAYDTVRGCGVSGTRTDDVRA